VKTPGHDTYHDHPGRDTAILKQILRNQLTLMTAAVEHSGDRELDAHIIMQMEATAKLITK
jgi:hypothetical protein